MIFYSTLPVTFCLNTKYSALINRFSYIVDTKIFHLDLLCFIVSNESISSTALCPRQGAGTLRDGSEQVCDSGLGLSDDETQLISGGRYRARATAPLHPAQSRIPETAQSPGHHITGGEAQAKNRDPRPIVKILCPITTSIFPFTFI